MALHVRRMSFRCPPSPIVVLVCFALVAVGASAQAQVATSITGNNVTPASSTQIVQPPPGGNVYGIQGGHTEGANLFHSFGQFNVGAADIAQFQTGAGANPSISNILGRVNGQQSPSQIFGAVDSATFYPAANLFMMNPYGFLFEPTATVNVGGMVAFTSADYLRLADGGLFNANANAVPGDVLTTAPVAAFGFLGSNPGAITVQGSQFTVTEGTGISLVGGNITIQSGTSEGGTAQSAQLSAPNGTMQLASTASPGEFDAATLQPLPNVNNTSFAFFGSVSLAPGTNINVSGEQTVSVRGGQFVIAVNDAVLSTAQSPGPPETISLSSGSSIISSTAGAEAGADVQLISSHVQMDGASIQSLTTGEGAGGTISITAALDGGLIPSTAGSIQMKGGQIQTASLGPGTVGDIQIHSGSLSMTDGALIDTLLVPNPLMLGQPGGGTIAITATDSIFITGQRSGITNLLPSIPGLPTFTNLPSGIYSENFSANRGPDVVVQTPSLTLKEGGLIISDAFGAGASGTLQIRASDSITMSGFFPGTWQLGPVVIRNGGSRIVTSTYGLGQAGQVYVSTSTLTVNGAHIASGSLGPGGAGDVNIQAATISLTGGASIDSSALVSGPGGNISVTASEQLSISGRSGRSFGFGDVTVVNNPTTISATARGTSRAGAISISTPSLIMFNGGLISTATGGDGPAGSIIVDAGSINLSSGASISSSSGLNVGVGGGFEFANGAGGTVTVNATGPVTIADQGSGLFTTTVGNGVGGNINLHGSAIQLSNGASISATSSGGGNAGNITLTAGNQLRMMNSSITTEASQSSGGAIKITTNPTGIVQLTDSVISASVLDGTGGGGSVNIDPQFVLLQNSQINANAVFGPGGNIAITTNLLLPDANSIISASSQFGQQGTVTIQSPNAPASGKILPLGKTPLTPTALLTQRCAAVTDGIFSSFTMAGRDSVPASPIGWLSSSLALAPMGESTGPAMQGMNGDDERPLLSLRRIAPPGFLTQSFAIDWAGGCTS